MNRLKRDSFLLLCSNLLQVIMALVISISYSKIFVDKGDFGKFQQIFVVINFLLSFSNGINASSNHFFGRYLKNNERVLLFRRFFNTILLFSIVAVTVLFFSKDYVSIRLDNEYIAESNLAIAFLLFLRILNSFFVNFCFNTKKLVYYFRVQLLQAVLSLMLVFYSFNNDYSLWEILFFFGCIEIIKFILLFRNLYSYLLIPQKHVVINRQEFNYVLPLIVTGSIVTLNVYIDKLMVASLLQPDKFAEYQVGAFVIPFMGIITASVITVLIPQFSALFADGNIKDLIALLRDAVKRISVLLIPILMYCVLFGRELIVLLYSERYATSGEVFQLYTVNFFLTVVTLTAVLNSVGQQKRMIYNSVINILSNIIFNFLLIKQFGVLGAVGATLISTYLGYVYPIYLMKKHLKAGFLEYFPFKIYSKIFLLSLIIGFVVLRIYNDFELEYLYSALLAPIYYLIVLVIANKSIFNFLDSKIIAKKMFVKLFKSS